MGTRHLIAVYSGGKYKIAQYGQWDGYFEGQGASVLAFLRDTKSVEKLKSKLSSVRFIDNKKDKKFISAYDKNVNQDNQTHEQKRWFDTYISRDIGNKILHNIANSEDKEILLENNISFACDSLFCEYAYVIDFDTGAFEVYLGFQKTPPIKGARFVGKRKNDYFAVALLKKYNIDNLPDENTFLSDLNKITAEI